VREGRRSSEPAFGLVWPKLCCVLIFSFFFIKKKEHRKQVAEASVEAVFFTLYKFDVYPVRFQGFQILLYRFGIANSE
jgi:hypothetical protein